MTPEREELIRETWKNSRYKWDHNFRENPILHLPIRYGHSVIEYNNWEALKPQEMSFMYQYLNGYIGPDFVYRIVCEGIVLEQGQH